MKKLRYFLETALLEAVAWILPRLPRGMLMALSRGIGTLAFHLDKRGRRTALDNLRCAFGDRYDDAGRRRIAKGSYQTFARTFLDLFWSSKLTKDTRQPFFDIHIPQPHIEERVRQTGGVWVTPHFGNFELISMVWGYRGFPFTVVAQDFKNEALTQLFRRLRESSGHTIIPQENAMLKLIKTLKRQGHAGLLTDLNIEPGKAAAAMFSDPSLNSGRKLRPNEPIAIIDATAPARAPIGLNRERISASSSLRRTPEERAPQDYC